jgi:hypothetical protein
MIDNSPDNKLANYWYPIQAWLTSTIFIAPLISSIITISYGGRDPVIEAFTMAYLLILFGLILSVPTIILLYFLFLVAIHFNLSTILIKLLTIIISIAGVIITLEIFGGSMVPTLQIVYSISAVISCLPYNVYKKISENKLDPIH